MKKDSCKVLLKTISIKPAQNKVAVDVVFLFTKSNENLKFILDLTKSIKNCFLLNLDACYN